MDINSIGNNNTNINNNSQYNSDDNSQYNYNIDNLPDVMDIPDIAISDINLNEHNKKNTIQFKNSVDLLTFEYFSKQKSYEKYLKNTSEKEKDNNNNLSFINKHDKKFYKKRIVNETKKMLKNEFDNEILKDSFNKYIFSLINYFKFKDKIDILQDEYKELDINREIYPITEVNTELCDDITDDINIDNIDYNSSQINELLYNFNKKELNKKVTLDNFIITTNKKQEDKKKIIPLQKNIDLREPSLKTKGVKSKNKKKEIITNNIETTENEEKKINTTSFQTTKNKEIQNVEP